jgi:hypothetical protein
VAVNNRKIYFHFVLKYGFVLPFTGGEVFQNGLIHAAETVTAADTLWQLLRLWQLAESPWQLLYCDSWQTHCGSCWYCDSWHNHRDSCCTVTAGRHTVAAAETVTAGRRTVAAAEPWQLADTLWQLLNRGSWQTHCDTCWTVSAANKLCSENHLLFWQDLTNIRVRLHTNKRIPGRNKLQIFCLSANSKITNFVASSANGRPVTLTMYAGLHRIQSDEVLKVGQNSNLRRTNILYRPSTTPTRNILNREISLFSFSLLLSTIFSSCDTEISLFCCNLLYFPPVIREISLFSFSLLLSTIFSSCDTGNKPFFFFFVTIYYIFLLWYGK